MTGQLLKGFFITLDKGRCGAGKFSLSGAKTPSPQPSPEERGYAPPSFPSPPSPSFPSCTWERKKRYPHDLFPVLLTLLLVTYILFNLSTSAEELSGDLVVFHSGSLSVPMAEMATAFKQAHPRVRILREAAGARECARKISDLGRHCDLMASADYVVIDTLLIPRHAAWNIKFAANEMVIAFRENSRYAHEITAENWHEILLRREVSYGRSDPNADPCGYRTVLTMKLAEAYYDLPGLAARLLDKDRRFIRPKETDFLALLEVGAIDYVFIYRSVAHQHGLKWIVLPDEINLKAPDLAAHYATVSVEITGTEPGTWMTQRGEPMVYGLTIPRNAPNPKAALVFAAFILEKDNGLAIMERNGQPSLVPSPSETYRDIPAPLKKYALEP